MSAGGGMSSKRVRSRPSTTTATASDRSPPPSQSPSRRRGPHPGASPKAATSEPVAVAANVPPPRPRGGSSAAGRATNRRRSVGGWRAKRPPPRPPTLLLPIPVPPTGRWRFAYVLALAAVSASLVAIYGVFRIPSSNGNEATVASLGQIAAVPAGRGANKDPSSAPRGAAASSSLKDRLVENLRGTTPSVEEARGVESTQKEELPFRKTQPSPAAPPCSTPLDPSDVSFTLVTQCSSDRLWMVRDHHCTRWPGHVSVAVHTDDTADEVLRYLTAKGGENEGEEDEVDGVGCSADRVHVTTIPTSSSAGRNGDGRDDVDGEYPVNALRNAALANVLTSHVFYVDVDFWTSSNLYDTLNLGFVRTELANDTKLALVVPSFEFRPQGRCWIDPEAKRCGGGDGCDKREERCRIENFARMPLTQDDLVSLIRGREAGVFDSSNVGGFLSTRYTDWFGMDEGDLLDVPCVTSNRYEPFFAVRYCRELPPYQEAFTGYGKNKITNIMHMRRMGYVFSQVGGVFAIHFPHGYSRVREVWNEGWDLRKKLAANHPKEVVDKQHDWTRYKRGRVDRVFVRFKRWLVDEVPDEARLQMCEDAQNDDVKLWV